MNSIRRRRREENDGEYYCNNAMMNTFERRRDVSLRSFSLSFSLSLVVTEQSAQNVMIFSPPKSSKTTEIFSTTKKNFNFKAVFFHLSVPLTTVIFTRNNTNNNNETRTKRERNKNKNDERVFIIYARVCVQKQCYTTLFTNKEFFAFLVLREFLILVKFDIIRISPRGERARFALNSKRNLRNVLDPVKRFFPRRWRL